MGGLSDYLWTVLKVIFYLYISCFKVITIRVTDTSERKITRTRNINPSYHEVEVTLDRNYFIQEGDIFAFALIECGKYGSHFPIFKSGLPLKKDSGVVIRLIWVLSDIEQIWKQLTTHANRPLVYLFDPFASSVQ